jgi:ComF family protein
VNLFEDFLNLVLPSKCVLCQVVGSSICVPCQQKHVSGSRAVERFNLQGFAVCEYNQEAAKLIHEFKEHAATSLAQQMAQSIAELVPESCKTLVPMPSRRQSFSNRGYVPAKVLAVAVAKQVAKSQKRLITVSDVLTVSKEVEDQASLSGAERRNNLIGAMCTSARASLGSVWLIDDIVTTGSTLQEAKRCLASQGVSVLGFLAFAETLPKSRQNVHGKPF